MIKHKHYSGGLMVLIGLGTAFESWQYSIGTLAHMGPGYYPFALGILLIIIGALIAFTPDSPDEAQADAAHVTVRENLSKHARAWVAVLGGMVAFIVLGEYGGLIPATFALVALAALGDPKNSLRDCVLLGAGVVAFAVIAFHYGMQMQFPLFTFGN